MSGSHYIVVFAEPYGTTLEMRVDQLASCVLVFPQRKLVARKFANVPVWLTYSDAIQIESPSLAAAPRAAGDMPIT